MSENDTAHDTMRRYETNRDNGDVAVDNAPVDTNADPEPESATQPEPAILPAPDDGETAGADKTTDNAAQEGRILREV